MRTANSRLEKLEEKRNARKAMLLSLFTLVLVVTAVIFGIPALVRVAVFVGDLKSATRPVDKDDTIAPVPPSLYSLYDATNSAQLTLNGLAEPGSTVFITDNGDPVGNVITKEDGTFQFSNTKLREGNNELKAVAVDQSSNSSSPSKPVVVFYSIKSPKLEVETPKDGQKLSSNDTNIEVKGATDAGCRILVNDRMAVVGYDGKWSYRVGLATGENSIVIQALDRAGNITRKEIKLTFVPQ